jgi:predicted PurR-regulated permease PerM
LIGKQISSVWTGASENIASLMTTLGPAAVDIGKWLLAAAGSLGMTVLVFFLSVIVAAVFLAYSERSSRMARRLAAKLAGEDGEGYVKAAESTVRSVALGVLGIAFIQSALAGLGMLVAGIPGAGFWAFVCLILAIVQIGGLPVLLPAAIYMFATSDTLSAVLFAIWVVIVGFSDNVLRPLLLGRGTDSPMLVVLIGSLGGMIASGIVGLFVGAVIFTLGYKLFLVWLDANT